MIYKLTDIAHETPQHFVLRVAGGFEVYKIGVTHSTRCAQIGFTGEEGLQRAIAEVVRRERLYHLVAVSEKTGEVTVLTGYPMPHHECCVMKSKISEHKSRRIELREVTE